jgi:hypothetical protein
MAPLVSDPGWRPSPSHRFAMGPSLSRRRERGYAVALWRRAGAVGAVFHDAARLRLAQDMIDKIEKRADADGLKR